MTTLWKSVSKAELFKLTKILVFQILGVIYSDLAFLKTFGQNEFRDISWTQMV